MKKIPLSTLLLAILMFVLIALSNPLTWFNHWTFQNQQNDTGILADKEKGLEQDNLQPNLTTSNSASNTTVIDPSIKIEKCKTSATITAKEYVKEVIAERSKSIQPVGCKTGNTAYDSACLAKYFETISADSNYLEKNAYDQAYLECLNGN